MNQGRPADEVVPVSAQIEEGVEEELWYEDEVWKVSRGKAETQKKIRLLMGG